MIGRIFVSTVARRVALVILAVVLSWVGIGSARAQASCSFENEGDAYAAAVSAAEKCAGMRGAGWSPKTTKSAHHVCAGQWTGIAVMGSGQAGCSGVQASYTWGSGGSCSSRPDTTGRGPWSTITGSARNGSIQCNSGCETMWNRNADGTMTGTTSASGYACKNNKDMCSKFEGYYWNAYLQACEPTEVECPAGKVKDATGSCVEEQCPAGMVISAAGTCESKKNECPAGNVKAPSGECLPGDGQCAAGEAKGKDGTCKRDSNGDGKPDSEEGEDDPNKDSASGGDTCNAPPTCNGNPVMCLQLRTQWRIDCNTRRNSNISGGACSAMPVCTGEKCDATEYAQLIQQWKSACALEKLANKSGGDDGGQPEWTKVGGMNQNPGAGEGSGDAPKLGEKKFNTDNLDQSGFGGGSCVGFAVGSSSGVMSGFMQTLASPPPFWCNFIAVLKAVFILVGAVASVFIISKGA